MPLVVAPNAAHQKKIPDKRRGEKGPRASISVPAPEPRQHLLHLLIGNQSTPKVKEKKEKKKKSNHFFPRCSDAAQCFVYLNVK